MKSIHENAFIQHYKEEAKAMLKATMPELPDAYLDDFLKQEVEKYIKDQDVKVINTYEEFEEQTTLLSIADYIVRTKPIVTGNGSMYVQHAVQESPLLKIIHHLRAERTAAKNKMFEAKQRHDDIAKDKFNRQQNTVKRDMNSGTYGVQAVPISYSYNISCASAITAQGRNIISAACWFIEGFIGSHVIYDNLDDVMNFVTMCINEPLRFPEKNLAMLIDKIPDEHMIIQKILDRFEGSKEEMKRIPGVIHLVIKNLDQIQMLKLYYKCSLSELLFDNPRIRETVLRVISKVTNDNEFIEWNDSNKVPEIIEVEFNEVWDILEEFCLMPKYIVYGKVFKYENHQRNTVMYSDTDSVFVYVGWWIFKILYWLEGIEEKDINMNELIKRTPFILKIVNMITRIIYVGIHKMYRELTRNANVDDEHAPFINAKSELVMDRYISFPNIKKTYVNRVIVQEGRVLDPPDVNMSGGNVNAKSKNMIVTKRNKKIITDITLDRPVINPAGFISEIYKFRDEIINSLKNGETKFASPIKVKDAEAYTDATSQSKFIAVMVYLAATEDKTVTLPGAFNMIDVNMGKLEDLGWLQENYPEIYENLKKNFFSDKKMSKNGIKYIALPTRFETIPEWIRPYVNIMDIWRKHLGPLFSLLPSLGAPVDTIKSERYYSTVMSI